MILEPKSYVPSLRWRQGEYQALMLLTPAAKARVTPLITIPPLEFDFESGVPKKTPHEHVFPFPMRLDKKWEQRAFWLDINPTLRDKRMNEGETCYAFLFEGVRSKGGHAIPIVSLDMDEGILLQLKSHIEIDQHGVGLRVLMTDLMKPSFNSMVELLLNTIGVSRAETDLIIDLEAPAYDPVAEFAGALNAVLSGIEHLENYRNYILVGTGFPESMGGIPKGENTLPRQHWLLYQSLLNLMPEPTRIPNFGDYTIVHPSFVALDMRKIKPAGKVIYSTSDAFKIQKGGSFRDDREQMHEHCEAVVAKTYYRGPSFSYGDEYIRLCADRTDGPSNLSRWKNVGINHHMTQVLDDLSNLSALT